MCASTSSLATASMAITAGTDMSRKNVKKKIVIKEYVIKDQECRFYRDYKRCNEHIVGTDPVIEDFKLVKEKLEVIENKIE
jgi:hypothetical protein